MTGRKNERKKSETEGKGSKGNNKDGVRGEKAKLNEAARARTDGEENSRKAGRNKIV